VGFHDSNHTFTAFVHRSTISHFAFCSLGVILCKMKKQPPKSPDGLKPKPESRTDYNSGEKYWGLARSEWVMAVLTLAGLFIAVFTGLIFWAQLSEMKIDQRAWLVFAPETTEQFPKDETLLSQVSVSTVLKISNSGKTAARKVQVEAVMDYISNGDHPDFVYDSRARITDTTGIVFPNSVLIQVPVGFYKTIPNSTKVQPRFLSPYEYTALHDGRGYMVVYASVRYLDIYDVEHWAHYCTFFIAPGAPYVEVEGARACTDYNDADRNEATMLRTFLNLISPSKE
jgi:hypothetical protein